jgi:hypothetical protein
MVSWNNFCSIIHTRAILITHQDGCLNILHLLGALVNALQNSFDLLQIILGTGNWRVDCVLFAHVYPH